MNRHDHWVRADELLVTAEAALKAGEDDAARAFAAVASVHAVLATGQIPLDATELAPEKGGRPVFVPVDGGRSEP